MRNNHATHNTSERVVPSGITTLDEYLIYLRHLFAYEYAAGLLTKDSRVLDIGCGEGYGAELLARHAASVVGVDVDEASIQRAGHNQGHAEFAQYDGKTLPFPDDSFDCVVSVQVIEHVHDDRRFVAEAERVLTDRGVFMLTTPNRAMRLSPGQRPWNRFHVREYSREGLDALLREHFSEVRIYGVFGHSEIQALEQKRLRKIRRLAALDPLGIMRVLPERVRDALARFGRRSSGKGMFGITTPPYSTGDFHVGNTRIEESLDLLCIARHSQ